MEINEHNIEEQILLYVDGELNAAEAALLLDYIARNPAYSTMLEDYRNTILEADATMIFPDKNSLLKSENNVVALQAKSNKWWAISAAAAALLIAVVGVNTFLKPAPVEPPVIAKNNIVPPRPATGNMQPGSISLNQQTTTKPTTTTVKKSKIGTSAVQKNQREQATAVPAPEREHVPMAPISTQKARTQPLTLPDAQPIAALNMQVPEAAALPSEGLRIPDWIPVTQERVETLNELLAQVKSVKEKVVEGGKSLRNADIALRIGDMEIGFGRKNN